MKNKNKRGSFCKAPVRSMAICALATILFGSASFGQETGFVTVGNDATQYTQFTDAYNVGGAKGTYTIHAGRVPVGSAISSGSATKIDMTIRSDQSGTERMIDLSQNPGNRFLAVDEDASTTVTGTTLTLNSIHFSHGASMENGGVIYANSDLELRGVGRFSTNRTSQHGGAIYVSNYALNLTGDGSEMLFFDNSDMSGKNDIVAKTVTLTGAGNYYFGGGVDAESITLGDGANVVFTPLSSSVTGFLSLTNSILKIQSEGASNFSVNGISADQNSLIIFEHAPQATTEILMSAYDASGLAPSSAMVALSGENTDGVAFISITAPVSIVTSLKTDGLNTINQFSKKDSSEDKGRVFTASAGSFGDFTSVNQDDLFILTGDANFGATYSSEVTDLTLSFQSNHADNIRTLTAGTMDASQQMFNLGETNATLKTYNMRFDGQYTTIDVNGGAMNAKNVNLIGTGTEFSCLRVSGENGNNGGVIYASEDVKINGQFVFRKNTALGSGGAIYAENDVDILGTNAFSSNHSGGMGGAIYAGNDVSIRGINTFSYNNSGAAGGAISGKTITLSGKNAFTWNTANGSNTGGGAIYADSKVTFNAGDYLFEENNSQNQGGAIYAASVEFKSDGAPMNAKFTGNVMSGGDNKNDIYTTSADGVQFNGAGTYSFDGGIQAQTLKLSGGADVTLEDGSVTQIRPNGGQAQLTLSDGASLNIVLNNRNQYESVQVIPTFNQGATQFTANGVNTASDDSVLRFVVDNAIEEKYYLGAIGDFTAINNTGMIISQINGGEGIANIVTENLGSAVWLSIKKGNSIAVRKSSGVTTQNEQNLFNYVFESGKGEAFASQDVIYLAGDSNATDEVFVAEGITSFGVVSNSADTVRKITATGDNRFFEIEGDSTITLDNVVFSGGKSTDDDGGAILSYGSTLTLLSLNKQTTFQSNSADCGGGIEADTLVLEGKHLFKENSATEDGGAIDVWNVTITGENYFYDNNATDGGAIWAQNLTFKGNNSKAFFNYNTATGKGADVFINSSSGTLTFKDNGIYSFSGGVYVEGTTEINDSAQVLFQRLNTINGATTLNDSAQVIFAEHSKNTINDLTINDSAQIQFKIYSKSTMDDLTINNSATVTFDTECTNTINGTTTINDSAQVLFASGTQNTMNNMAINDSSQITFGINAQTAISGMTTFNVQQVEGFAHRATLNFNGGLTIGDGVKQKFNNANVTVADTLSVTYGGDPNKFNSQVDFTNAKSLSIADGTKFVIYDTNGNEMTGKNFAGKVLGTSQLVIGSNASTELQKIVTDDFNYESLFYSVSLEGGTDIILKSIMKNVNPQAIERNVAAAVDLFGTDLILDVKSADELRVLTNGATGELFASSAQVQTDRLNYLNRLIITRTTENSTMDRSEGTIRGQNADRQVSSLFNPCCYSANHLNKPDLWASGYYIAGETQTYGNINGQSYSTGGMLAGADWTNDLGKFGLFYGYGETGIDAIASNLESKDHTFGIWARWNSVLGPGYTTVLGDFSFSDGEGHRFFQGNAWESNYNAWQGAAYLERGLEFEGKHWNLNPYFALQYVGYSADPSADAQLQFNAMEADSLRSILGLRFDRDFCLRERNANISTGFAWDHELLNNDLVFTAERIGGGTVTPILGNSAGQDWFEYNTGLAIDLSEGLTFSANYYLFVNKYTTLNAGMGTVTFRY